VWGEGEIRILRLRETLWKESNENFKHLPNSVGECKKNNPLFRRKVSGRIDVTFLPLELRILVETQKRKVAVQD